MRSGQGNVPGEWRKRFAKHLEAKLGIAGKDIFNFSALDAFFEVGGFNAREHINTAYKLIGFGGGCIGHLIAVWVVALIAVVL